MREPPDHIRLDILTDAMRKLGDVEAALQSYKQDLADEGLEDLEEEIFNLRCLMDSLSREASIPWDSDYF